jgi:hypothetical protein
MLPLKSLALCLLASSLLAVPAPTQETRVPKPADILGFTPGEDGRLLRYEDSIRYFEALAKASPRVELETIGKSSFGRDIRLAWIGAEPLLAAEGAHPRDASRMSPTRGDSPRTANRRFWRSAPTSSS